MMVPAKASAGRTSSDRPTIVHVLADDLGWQDLRCCHRGSHKDEPFYETPHIDRLAEREIRFTQAYCDGDKAAFRWPLGPTLMDRR